MVRLTWRVPLLISSFGLGAISLHALAKEPAPMPQIETTLPIQVEKTGKLVRVEVGINRIRIRTDSEEIELKVTPATLIIKEEQAAALHHVFEGETNVRVIYNQKTKEIRKMEILE